MAVDPEQVTEVLSSNEPEWANPTPAERYDLVVVGDTPEAILAARLAGRRRRKVALVVADGPPYHRPAPLKTAARQLRDAARSVSLRRRSPGSRGVGAGRNPEYADVIEKARRALDDSSASSGRPIKAGSAVDLFRGQTRFLSPDALEVGAARIVFRRAILATGRGQSEEELSTARSDGCIDPSELLRLHDLPPRLAVVGTTAPHCEWAQTFSRLGSQVHLLGRESFVLPDQPEAVARRVRSGLAADGVALHLGCEEIAWERTGTSYGVLIRREGEPRKLFVDQVLVHCPRRPRVAGLELEKAGVACSEAGVEVDSRLRTTNRRIYAVGEVCGADFAAPVVGRTMTRRAVANAMGIPLRRFSGHLVPRCVHTQPEVVRFGWTADEAARRSVPVRTLRLDLPETDFGTPDAAAGGFVEAVVRHRSGRLVGATIVAASAAELAAPLIVVASRGMSLSALADVSPCCPGPLESLSRLARSCRRVLPWRPWSVPQEEAETVWGRFRRWRRGNDEGRNANDEGMTKHE